MTTFSPLAVRIVQQEWADQVPSPAHDALTPEERRAFLTANPNSYLAVTRSPEDASIDGGFLDGGLVDGGVQPNAVDLLHEGRRALDHLLDLGAFSSAHPPRFYVYRLESKGHRQTGLVGGIALDDYRSSTLRVHEQVQVDRTAHLAQHLGVVGAQSSPIAVAFRPNPVIEHVVEAVTTSSEPSLTAIGDDGLAQRVWPVKDPTQIAKISEALAGQPTFLVDGHHRAAAALAYDDAVGTQGSAQILVAAFPSDQLLNRAFHRVIVGRSLDNVLTAIGDRLGHREIIVSTSADATLTERADDEIVLAGGGRWVALRLPKQGGEDASSLLADLDPVRMEDQLLRGVLGIDATAGEDHLRYRPGNIDLVEIARATSAEGSVLCVSRPVPVEVVLAAADARLVMPPKSTYFEPKVRSGVFVRSIVD